MLFLILSTCGEEHNTLLIGPTLVAIATFMLPSLGSFAALTE
jgi:hypothetical protein